MDKYSDSVHHVLGGSHEKPAKRIRKIEHEKSHNGDHIITHKHHNPEHHPDETHTKRGDDELVEHMLQHAGTPNPGEDTSDPGSPAALASAPSAPPAGAGGALAAGSAAPPAGV